VVEQRPPTPRVEGSTPSTPANSRLKKLLQDIADVKQIDQLPWLQQEARQILGEFIPVDITPGLVHVVEDRYQYDGGSVILGIYEDANQALILQQKIRRHYKNMYKNTPAALVVQTILNSVCIRAVRLNKDLFHHE
jgi:hypothetical protein